MGLRPCIVRPPETAANIEVGGPASLRSGQGSATLALLRIYPGELAADHDFSNPAHAASLNNFIYPKPSVAKQAVFLSPHKGGNDGIHTQSSA